MFLMQGHEKLSVIEYARSLPRPFSNGAFSGLSSCMMRCTCGTSQRINTSCSKNSLNWLREALAINIMKIKWLLGRLRVDGFDRHINLRQEDKMVAHRGLIVDRRVKLD